MWVYIYHIDSGAQRAEGIECLRTGIAVSCELGGIVVGKEPGSSKEQ